MPSANRKKKKRTEKNAYKPSVQLRTREGRDVPLGLSGAGIQQQQLKTSRWWEVCSKAGEVGGYCSHACVSY